MKKEINEAVKISPFLVFFLINSIQIGIGILGFQQTLVQSAGNDSWIPVLIAGIAVHIIIWILYQLLNKAEDDLIGIHKFLFGKWIGGLFSMVWIIYFTLIGMTVLFSYVEVIRVWMFPEISVFWMTVVFLLLVLYTVFGGFRTVTGICFLGTVIPAYLAFTFFFPLPYSDFLSLLPVWDHTIKEIGAGTREVTLSFLGFSTLLLYYPYIKQAKDSQKWAHLGALLTTFIYLLLIVLSLGYFSEQQLIKQLWATLTLWKIVEMPFVERFEYIGITSWALIILPNLCLVFWAASRGMKRVFNMDHRKALIVVLLVVLISNFFFRERAQLEVLRKWTAQIGFYSAFVYIPILYLLYQILSKVRRKKN
jgi:spore germination protein (amino acid permease)